MAEKDSKAKGKGKPTQETKIFGIVIAKGPVTFLKWHMGAILMVVGVGVAVAFYFTLYSNTRTEIQNVTAEYEQKQDKLRRIQSIKEEREKTEALILQKQANLVHLEQQLPDFKFIPDFMVQLEQLMLGYNMKPALFKPQDQRSRPRPPPPTADSGATPPPPGQEEAPKGKEFNASEEFADDQVELGMYGQYNDILGFLQELSVFPKVVVVDELEMKVEEDAEFETPLQEGERDSLVKAELIFKFYSRREGGDDTPKPLGGTALKLDGQPDSLARQPAKEQTP